MKAALFSNRISELIDNNRGAEAAYAQVLERTESRAFGELLENSLEMRLNFIDELDALLTSGDHIPRQREADEPHPSYLHLHELFSTNDDAAMLRETIEGEKRTIDLYNTVLTDPELPGEKAEVMRRHVAQLRDSLKAFRELQARSAPQD